jgi:hypothetical protein
MSIEESLSTQADFAIGILKRRQPCIEPDIVNSDSGDLLAISLPYKRFTYPNTSFLSIVRL